MNDIPSIDSLHREKSTKEDCKIQIFNIVLSKCVEKIVYTNRNTDKTFVIFEVPKLLIGFPSYDMKLCILFLMKQLTHRNYIVSFIEPFYLLIDWGSNSSITSSKTDKLKRQTRDLLQKFPNTSKVEYIYEDAVIPSSKHKNKIKKKKK